MSGPGIRHRGEVEKTRQKAWEMLCGFEKECEESVKNLVIEIERDCKTYKDVDETLEFLEKNSRAYASRKSLHLAVDMAKKMVGEEKSRLLVADGPYCTDHPSSITETAVEIIIKGEPKELAALVLAVQGRPELAEISKDIAEGYG